MFFIFSVKFDALYARFRSSFVHLSHLLHFAAAFTYLISYIASTNCKLHGSKLALKRQVSYNRYNIVLPAQHRRITQNCEIRANQAR